MPAVTSHEEALMPQPTIEPFEHSLRTMIVRVAAGLFSLATIWMLFVQGPSLSWFYQVPIAFIFGMFAISGYSSNVNLRNRIADVLETVANVVRAS